MLRLKRFCTFYKTFSTSKPTKQRQTRCLVLHPVSYPNKGPIIEQYLAQQAIGLVSSLKWNVVQGPFWNAEKLDQMIEDKQSQNKQQIRDGSYFSDINMKGTFYNGGVIVDLDTTQSDGDLYQQWSDKLKRSSLANKCLIRTRYVTSKLFFTRGKAQMIAKFVKNNDVDCIFVNNQLTPVQIKNLKKLFEAKANDKPSPRSISSQKLQSQTQFQTEAEQKQTQSDKKIKIFDRFSIILQIFARRAKTSIAKLQIQLNFLNYLKTKIVRNEGSTYSSTYNIFYGDLMRAQQLNLQIVSARQRRAHATISGAGQSQLQIQRRQIRDKQTKIKRQLEQQKRIRNLQKQKKKVRRQFTTQVGLVGYTNAGKSKLMNRILRKNQVSSADLLFQTLSTTSRQFGLPSGRKGILLDTIGFITNLPHELIESFKTTLQQVQDCTIILHIRDISNPNNDLQKETVLKVLRQLNFAESFYTERMIEVWNKIDLLPDDVQAPPGVFQISALKGTGIKQLLEQIERTYKFKYDILEHQNRKIWLKQNTNLVRTLNQSYDYQQSSEFPNGSVQYEIQMDPKSYGKFMKYLGQSVVTKKTKKGMPPPDWHKK